MKWKRDVCAYCGRMGIVAVSDVPVSLANSMERKYGNCAVVNTPYKAKWTNVFDGKTFTTEVDYEKGDILALGSWRPEGYSDVRRLGFNTSDEPRPEAPQMVGFWRDLEKNCTYVEIVNV